MKPNTKIKNLIDSTETNKVNLSKKENTRKELVKTRYIIQCPIIIYDSGWLICSAPEVGG